MFLKKVDKLVLKAFFGPFILTFFVVVFILLVQNMLQYLNELLGKGLSILTLGELLFYFSLNLVPVALPLAVLISSLITFGNLGEHYELTALKSAGISLVRALTPIFIVTLIVSAISFWFNDRIVPKANLNAYSLLYDIRQKKPSLDLKQGSFYKGLPSYVVKVNKKNPDGKTIEDIMIYDHSQALGNTELVVADSGKMYTINNDNYLVLELYRGKSYHTGFALPDQQASVKVSDEFMRTKFSSNKLIFSLESFGMNRTDKTLFANNKIMRNINQLEKDIDSLKEVRNGMEKRAFTYIVPSYIYQMRIRVLDSLFNRELYGSWQDSLWVKAVWEDKTQEKQILSVALSQSQSINSIITTRADLYKNVLKDANSFSVEKYRKYTHAVACLIMFLIGAPLGAIIKKGGLGVPILISIIFFIIFYILSMTGEKWAKDSVVQVPYGMWGADFILFWVGLFFLRQARNDSRILETDIYLIFLDNIKQRFGKKQKNKTA